MILLDNFVKSYTDKTYKYVTTVRHKGTVIAFSMDAQRQIYYTVLDLNDSSKDKSPLDVNYWPDNPTPLPFGNEIAQVGYGIIDPEVIPTVKKGTRQVVDPSKLRPEEVDPFLSTTARLSADAPFQVISDNQYIYLFRQSIDATHEDNIPVRKDDRQVIVNQTGDTVYLVDDTLLLDRFALTGNQLHPKMEVRFKRSRNKYRPQSNKDSLGAQDMNKKPFREPTQNLDFVENLRDGRFSVLLLPTQVAGVQRWQIFTHNQKTGLIDSFNVERSDDGLFNTQGSQFYTSPDPKYQKSVYEREPGTDPFTGKPLIPVVTQTGYAESALEFENGYVTTNASLLSNQSAFTIEGWIKPGDSSQTQSLFGQNDVVEFGLLDNKLILTVWTPTSKSIATNYPIDGQWHHVAAVGSRDHLALYIDGIAVATTPLSIDKDYGASSSPFQIGAGVWSGGSSDPFKETIDEVRLWQRARSESEILEDLHYRLEGNEPGLTAYWRFDENFGSTVNDLTANGHNGTLQGDYRWVTSDAPIGERPGICRSSFALTGRSVESGLSALLYYQQEKATTGYNTESKPIKRQARVMLTAGTAEQHPPGNEQSIAAVDFAVSRDGKLAQMLDQLDLGEALSQGTNKDLERLEELEQQLERLRQGSYYLQGDNPNSFFGCDIAVSENWAIFAANGGVCVFHWENEEWVKKQKLLPHDTQSNNFYANSVALSADWAIIENNNKHAVYVFHLENEVWVEKQKLVPHDRQSNNFYPSSIALSGDWAIVGARWDNNNAGVAYLFHLENGQWVEKQKLLPHDLQRQDCFGRSVALFGDWAIVGADKKNSEAGAAYIFHLENGQWVEKQKLLPHDTQRFTRFGTSVALSGDWAIVGSYHTATYVGAAYIFHLENYRWVEKQKLVAHDQQSSEFFGLSVALSGDWAIVGADQRNNADVAAYLFHLENYRWVEKQKLLPDDIQSEGRVGCSVALSPDWYIFGNSSKYNDLGAAYIFPAQDQIAQLSSEINQLKARVGEAVAFPMHLLHRDPDGLSITGGLLGFANNIGSPQLFDSATGKLALYYPGKDKQFFAAYYDTQTAKAQYTLPVSLNPTETDSTQSSKTSSLLVIARSADPFMDNTEITIGDSSDSDLCTVTMTNSTTSITETWNHVPRQTAAFAKVLNGLGADPVFIGTLNADIAGTVTSLSLSEPVKRSLKTGDIVTIGDIKTTVTAEVNLQSQTIPIPSTHIQGAATTPINLIAYDYSQATTNQHNYPLKSGSRYIIVSNNLTEGHLLNGTYTHNREATLSCQWVSDAPGKALAFDGSEYVYLAQQENLGNLDFKGDLTLEAWVQPTDGSMTVLNHHSGHARYTLRLQAESEGFVFVAGAGEAAKKSKVPFGSRQKQWHHLAAVYNQSYGLEFNGQANLEVTSAEVLNQDGDITIEVFLQPHDLSQPQGLLAKGKLNDGTSDRVPYALYLNTNGSITFVFEDSNGNGHSFTSTRTIEAGTFAKVAVTRQHKSKTNKIEVDKDHPDKVRDIDFSQIYEQWTDVYLYINGQAAGYARYEGSKPGTNGQPLEIGKVSNGSSESYFKGIMSEVRLWSKALVSADMGQLLQGKEQGLVSWWRFEENEGNVATDSKGGQDAKILAANWVKNPDPTTGSSLVLYQDGVPVATENTTISDWGTPQFTLGGIRDDNNLRQGFKGTLEEVRIWKVPRTQEQIQDNIFSRLKGEIEYLIANYTFDKEDTTQLRDYSLLGNDLSLGTDKSKPNFILSTAPIGTDAAIVRSSLAGVETKFQGTIDSRPGVEEYGDLQRDADGNLMGLQKRCYSYIKDGQWQLLTGYKVGNLKTEWISQVQFDPQVIGFIEGAPPVPSENLTEGTLDPGKDDCADASSLEVVEAESVSYSFGASQEGSFDTALDVTFKQGAEAEVYNVIVAAPLGVGTAVATQSIEAGLDIEDSVKFETSASWLSDKSVGASRNVTKNTQVSLGGNWEDPTNKLNPTVGRRFQPSNMGFALVQSETADLFALRMEHNNALVCFRMLPNPDIPKDWNIIPFPINPAYSKQGTLDGSLGYDDAGSKVCDPDYPMASSYGEYSYFKPKEAYLIKNRINRQEQELATYYQSFNANFVADRSLPEKFAKRNLVNTYVWTADGGFFAESTELSEVRQESISSSFSFSTSYGENFGFGFSFFGSKLGVELDVSLSGGLNITKTKSKESETSFSVDVGINVPGDLQKYDNDGNRVYTADHKPINLPGKVDAYRFMTFYMEGSNSNFAQLFNKVVDPIWLEQSDHPNASAMRQAKQSDKQPPCWRVFHRVTFISRILPEFTSDAIAPVEKAMKAANIASNWELIKKLEPFVKNKTDDASIFAKAVRQTIATYLPELEGHEDEIIKYAALYFGVQDM